MAVCNNWIKNNSTEEIWHTIWCLFASCTPNYCCKKLCNLNVVKCKCWARFLMTLINACCAANNKSARSLVNGVLRIKNIIVVRFLKMSLFRKLFFQAETLSSNISVEWKITSSFNLLALLSLIQILTSHRLEIFLRLLLSKSSVEENETFVLGGLRAKAADLSKCGTFPFEAEKANFSCLSPPKKPQMILSHLSICRSEPSARSIS